MVAVGAGGEGGACAWEGVSVVVVVRRSGGLRLEDDGYDVAGDEDAGVPARSEAGEFSAEEDDSVEVA